MSEIRTPRVRASELVGRGWLNTGGRSLDLADLRGRLVILDFWTFCCVNCLHVLDELRELEARYRDVLVIVGVHSPKFEHEADPVALAAAVERYSVEHPVLDDPELVTWGAYTARAWPTLVVIDPEGYVVAQMAGEGHASALEALVASLVAEHEAKGTLHRGVGPYVPPAPTSGTLRFPAKAVALPGGTLLVADAGHHSLAELGPDGETLVRRIGSEERGLVDGGPGEARFSEPNGLCLVPSGLRERLGYDVVVADTVNHALRGVRLADGLVTTLAGTGEQFMVGGQENVVLGGRPRPYDGTELPSTAVRLSSPWDVAWSDVAGGFVVAMAGTHTLWLFDPTAPRPGAPGTVRLFAGTMNEGLEDGTGETAWFAQPSGLAPATRPTDAGGDGQGPAASRRTGTTTVAATRGAAGARVAAGVSADQETFWVADSETSALRSVVVSRPVGGPAVASVRTSVGAGLFDFGHRDGDLAEARLQHPLGVVALPDGSVVVADTYNGALRRVETWWDDAAQVEAGRVTTVATGLAEPSDVLVEVSDDGRVTLVVVESAAHRLTRVPLPASLAGEVLDHGARRTQRPATAVAPGTLRLEVPFLPAPGQKLDDRWGPSTSLQVSATPPELLLSGSGDGTDLFRDVVVNPAIMEGVLHVTAKAASCDAEGDFPACHLAQQDWGVPLTVTPAGEATLTLPLRG
ncbi:NHL domain-containing thioredoxin family protein [Xylanimonas protaetiae]|uniref:Redoxin domain-containing protein n=1 Tax=Xylanimonas protaetiae TaxID=2509457 RepID=A0A4P6F1L8_9MICO|nr:NHL domain-containing thioredoxin family protein [Xylanimonas protaetiae]QAY69364.1 redoxin domain-containing protein [Xylanimonas protaetiae]